MFLPYRDEAPRDPGSAWVTKLLIAINVIVWFVTAVADDASGVLGVPSDAAILRWAYIPKYPSLVTALTCMFMHGSFLHIAGNMWFLYLFGDNVELRMGHIKYFCCYMLAGLGGTFLHTVFFPDSDIPTLGASGAIYGVMGMYLYLFPFNRVRFFYFLLLFVGTTQVSALFAIGFFFVTEALMSYLSAYGNMQSDVGHFAHAGGFVVGFVCVQGLTAWGFIPNDGWTIGAWLRGKRRPATAPSAPDSAAYAPDGRTYVEPEPDPSALLTALIRAERMEEARRMWRREAFDNHRLTLPVREMLALALYLDRSGDGSAARDAYERVIATYPGQQPYEAEAHLALAGMLLSGARSTGDRGDLSAISEHLRQAIEQHPIPARKELAQRWLSAVQNTV